MLLKIKINPESLRQSDVAIVMPPDRSAKSLCDVALVVSQLQPSRSRCDVALIASKDEAIPTTNGQHFSLSHLCDHGVTLVIDELGCVTVE